jgi:hypothetical protein
LDAASESDVGNDDESNWCFPDPLVVSFPWECSVTVGKESATNYGTPGVAGSCP